MMVPNLHSSTRQNSGLAVKSSLRDSNRATYGRLNPVALAIALGDNRKSPTIAHSRIRLALSLIRNGLDLGCHVVDASRVMQILTTGKTTAERAASRCGIPCSVRRPKRSGPNRCSYHQCLQQNAAAADATLVLGNRVPPYNADIDSIWGPKPIRLLSIASEMRFHPNGDSTRRWLRKYRIKRLHVTGTAPTAMASKFLMALLKPQS